VPAVLPFYHIYGVVVVLLGRLAHGCKIVTLPKFEPKYFFKLLDQHQVLLTLSSISTACFNPQIKYLFVILTNLTGLFMDMFQISPSVCCAVCQLMKFCVQLVTSLCTPYKAVATEFNSSLMKLVTRLFSLLKHTAACLFFNKEPLSVIQP
jgi:acyl-CoA synthetase (AMP-forming)/AMP-acid ligase II